MANANLALLTTSNTFLDWMITTNNEANTINELRNGNFYKDGGNFTVANGTIIGLSTTGTGLQIAANTILSALTTMNTSLTTSQASFSDNVLLSSVNSSLQAANSIQTKYANVNTAANITGSMVLTGKNANGNVTYVTTISNEPTINVANNVLIANTGITEWKNNINFSNASASVNVAGTLNANVGQISTLNTFTTYFDPTHTYNQVNGNAVFNNLTVSGNQIIQGSQVISASQFQIRTNAASDGDGFFEVYRGPTINANGTLKFNHTANVYQFAANDAQSYVTLLTTANVVDGFTSNSTSNTISANAAQTVFNIAIAAYAQANSAANTVRVGVNSNSVLFANGINFVNTANVTLTVSYDGTGNANVSIFSSAGQPPGGANQQIQFNDNTLFNGSANVIYNKANGQMVVNNETVVANLTFATGANAVQPTLFASREGVSNSGVINTPNTTNVDLSITNNWDITTANTTQANINITFINWANSGNLQTCTIVVRQPGPNANTNQSSANGVTFTNANVVWSNGEVPVLAAFKGKLDILTFMTTDGGAHVWGAHSMANVG